MQRKSGLPWTFTQVVQRNIDLTRCLLSRQHTAHIPRLSEATAIGRCDPGSMSECFLFFHPVCSSGGWSSSSMSPSRRATLTRKSSWAYPLGRLKTPGCTEQYSVIKMKELMTAHSIRSYKRHFHDVFARRKRRQVDASWSNWSTPPMYSLYDATAAGWRICCYMCPATINAGCSGSIIPLSSTVHARQ